MSSVLATRTKPRRLLRTAASCGVFAAVLATEIVVGGVDVGAIGFTEQVVAAPTFTVTTNVDTLTTACQPTPAPPASPPAGCSLRGAVAAVNALATTITTAANPAKIVVPAETYRLNLTAGTDIGDLDLRKPMTITGAAAQPGTAATTIDGNLKDRVFEVLSTGVTLEGLVITRGTVSKADGGGILVARNFAATIRTSTVTGNTATNGGGISVAGSLTVERSTFTTNTATGRGGGIDVVSSGSLTASNSTFHSNTANGGGGINSAGSATLQAVTVTANNSNNSNGGGIARNGGSFTISGSILAGNNGASGRDCSGSPAFASQNIVQNTPGCNPTGVPLIIANPNLGALTNNGGPTLTRVPGTGPALDAVGYTSCVTGVDQRGVARPAGATSPRRCDIGSVEVAPLTVDVSLAASATPPAGATCPVGATCVGVGVDSVAVDKIPSEALVATTQLPEGETEATYARRTYARRTYARRTYARRTDLLQSALVNTDLRASAAAELTLEDLYARRTYARRTSPIEQVLLSEIPLFVKDSEGKDLTWEDLLDETAFEGVPLQYITLFDVLGLPQVAGLTLGEADIVSTALQDLSGVALALAPLSLSDMPLDDGGNPLASWCALIEEQLGETGCNDLGINAGTIDETGLVTLQLGGVNIEEVGIESIYARRTDLSGTYLESIYARRTDLEASDIGAIYARRTAASSAALEALLICTTGKFDCDDESTTTLAEFQAAGLIKDSATIADLLAYLETQTEADLISLFDLLVSLTEVLFPGDGVAFEQIDLRATPLQNFNSTLLPPATFTANITVGGGAPANTKVVLTIPEGFEPVAGSAKFDGATIPDGVRDGQELIFNQSSVLVGPHTLSVEARAGIDLGTKEAKVDVEAVVGAQKATDSATTTVVVVVESFEKNGAPGDFRTLSPSTINVAHISSSYDTDLYSFEVSPDDATAGVTARIDLSNLARDYDLVLYGPKSASLRASAPKARIQPVEDSVLGFDSASQQLAPDVQLDVSLAAPADCDALSAGNQPCFPSAIAAQRGTKDELIETGTLIAGTYWIRVSGYNGEFGPEPYVLRLIRDQGTPLGVCTPRPLSPASTGDRVSYPAGVTASTATGYILVPEGRLLAAYDDAAVGSVMAGVNAVAVKTGNAVVRVDAYPSVKGAYDAWDAAPCSIEAANNVVREIGKVLDGLDATTPNASTVTLVGNHIMLPMGLVADGTSIGNENTYDPGVLRGQDTSLTAALKAGYVQTDTPYATSAGYLLNSEELYVPDRAVGRLVETPEQIAATLNRFAAGQVLDPDTTTSAFVSGYDFIGDGAEATAKVLAAQPATTVEKLINEFWTADQLEQGLIGDDPDLASISAHFDHNRAVPALADETGVQDDLFLASDVAAADNLTNALVLSIGCHSGLSVPDVELSLTDKVDWAQTFAGEGATYFGNTGYGYGDTELVAYSERLQVLFAEQLRTGATVGAAMMAAKQAYFSELTAVSPYDAKVLSEWTLYGLPMWQVGGAFPRAAATPPAPADMSPPNSVVQPPVVLTEGTLPAPNVLTPKVTETGTYYQQNGNTIAVQNRPVQPSVERDVTIPGREAHGVLITDAVSKDLGGFQPYYAKPIIDQAENEELVEAVGDAVFPTTLARVSNPVQADGTTESTLTLAAGQFRRNIGGTPGVGTQRLFTRLETEVTYADPSVTDFDAPQIIRSEGSVVNNTVGFAIRTATDAARVFVLYKVTALNEWAGVDLVRTGTDPVDGSAIWTGGAVLPGTGLQVEFLGQAVDAAGNVAYTVNKTSNFLAAPTATCSLQNTVTAVAPGRKTDSGWFFAPSGVTVTFAPGTLVSVDGAAFSEIAVTGVVVTGEGVHRVQAVSGDQGCTITVPIDTKAPTVTATLDPTPNAAGWNSGSVDVLLKAVDPGGSGVQSVTYSVTTTPVGGPAVTGLPVTVLGDSAVVKVPKTSGETVISFSAVDAAENAGTPVSTTVKVDADAPTLMTTIDPAPNAAGWNTGPVNVKLDAADTGGSGVERITYSVNGGTSVIVSASSATVPVSANGSTTITALAVDAAGNVGTTVTTTVKIDRAAPTVSGTIAPAPNALGWNEGSVNVALMAVDPDGLLGSGVQSITYSVNGGTPVTTPGATATVPVSAKGSTTITSFATDVAGNTGPTTTTTVRIDGNIPMVSSEITPGMGTPAPSNGWYRGPVSVDVTGVDAETGIREIRTRVGSTTRTTLGATASEPVTAQGPTQVFYTAVDRAGNLSAEGSATVYIDTIAPNINITSPPTNVAIGDSVTAGFTCIDPGATPSGPGSCTAVLAGPGVPDGQAVSNGATLPTSMAGLYTLTVSATDLAGNPASQFRTYTVAERYLVCRTYDPATKQNGSAYAVSFRLCDAAGNTLSSSSIVVTAVSITNDATKVKTAVAPGGSNPTNRFTLSGGIYSYTLKTTGLALGSYSLDFTVNGVSRPIYVLPVILK